jgi:hypothetical protein
VYRVLVGKPEGKRPLERPRRKWEVNIKMDFQEVECGAGTGSMWLRTGTGGGHLFMPYSVFGFHKIWGIS